MINLLSDIKKTEIRAARTNTILLRYIIVLIIALLFIAGSLFVSYRSLKTSEASADAQIALPQGVGSEKENTTPQVNMSEITATLQSSTKISQVLTTLASSLPPGTVIKSLDIKPEHLSGSPLQISIYAKQAATAETINETLAASGIFTNISATTASTTSSDVQGHPVKIDASMTITTHQSARGGLLP